MPTIDELVNSIAPRTEPDQQGSGPVPLNAGSSGSGTDADGDAVMQNVGSGATGAGQTGAGQVQSSRFRVHSIVEDPP